VLNQAYATQIAREWNTEDAFSGYCGIVTRFNVEQKYLARFKIENVGAAMHNELWVPAEELDTFNKHIHGKIEVADAFFGAGFSGFTQETVKTTLLNFIP
jgi:hypothetical protein